MKKLFFFFALAMVAMACNKSDDTVVTDPIEEAQKQLSEIYLYNASELREVKGTEYEVIGMVTPTAVHITSMINETTFEGELEINGKEPKGDENIGYKVTKGVFNMDDLNFYQVNEVLEVSPADEAELPLPTQLYIVPLVPNPEQ
ncbi:hypothetical protein [Persicobacter diffluens]|uniref:Uncharacterized protein n=1 Tax=Persicobacter diffluens TaxID=981 RepID=A0AAN5AL06_9BACT|nr:hypothetical protein PEDI_39370 [Persicobacter diffluens]